MNPKQDPQSKIEDDPNEINLDSIDENVLPRRQSLFTMEKLNERYQVNDDFSAKPLKGAWNYMKKYYKPTPEFFKRQLFKRIPFIDWIRHYNVKEWLLPDIVSGLTIGVVHIPQGLAYAILAGLPPVTGLYVSFFPVLLYAFMGTSRHLSIGTFAVPSLMILAALNSRVGKTIPPGSITDITTTTAAYSTTSFGFSEASTSDLTSDIRRSIEMSTSTTTLPLTNNNYFSDDPAEARVMVATALALVAGLIQIAMAILHVGYVSVYLSDSIIQGFTTGCSIHIITSQIPTLLGISIKTVTGQSKIIKGWIEIFKNIKYSNGATCIISAITITLFATVRDQINERFKGRMPIPVPIELIIVILGTGLSAAFDFNERWNVKIVGSLPLGIPAPTAPSSRVLTDVLGEAIALAIVCFVINISMSKLFATKFKYQISPNQELFAYGLGNVVTSFFQGFPACVALSRCAVIEGTGGKTQVVGILASIVVLVVILAVGPVFRTLPNACLASIIVTAMKNMLLQTKQLPILWRTNKLEFLAWIITFLGVVLLDVDYGLYVGVAATILLLIIRSQKPHAALLGYLSSAGIYEDKNAYSSAIDIPKIRIFRFEENIFYANVEMFKKLFAKRINFRVDEQLKAMNAEIDRVERDYKALMTAPKEHLFSIQRILQKRSKMQENANKQNETTDEDEQRKYEEEKKQTIAEIRKKYQPEFDCVIIDCSPVNYMDIMGIKVLIQLFKDFKEIGVCLMLCQVRPTIYRQLKRMKYFDVAGQDTIHVTIDDAVLHAIRLRGGPNSTVTEPGATVIFVGVENAAYVIESEESEPESSTQNQILPETYF